MVVAIVDEVAYQRGMTTLGIPELEELLRVANEAVARLTLANAELTGDVHQLERVAKKLKRKTRRSENTHKVELAAAMRGR
jgi:hypothetical protein